MDPSEPITREEFDAFRKRYARRIKKVEDLVSDAFQAISDSESNLITRTDEAVRHAERAERAVRRLRKEYDDHEH